MNKHFINSVVYSAKVSKLQKKKIPNPTHSKLFLLIQYYRVILHIKPSHKKVIRSYFLMKNQKSTTNNNYLAITIWFATSFFIRLCHIKMKYFSLHSNNSIWKESILNSTGHFEVNLPPRYSQITSSKLKRSTCDSIHVCRRMPITDASLNCNCKKGFLKA